MQAGKHNPAPGGFPSALHGKEPGPNATTPGPHTFCCLAGLGKQGLALHPEASGKET